MSAPQALQDVSSRAPTLQVALFAAASVDIDWTPMPGLALVSHVCSHVSGHVSHVCSHVTPHSPAHTTIHV